MADLYIQSETLEEIATAIRGKSGSNARMTPAGMATRIGNLSYPSGTITVNENGTYNVRNYKSAIVQTGTTGSKFSYGWNDNTGRLTIQDDNNPLPEGVGEDTEE